MASYPLLLALTDFGDTTQLRVRFLPIVFVFWRLQLPLRVSSARPILDQSMGPWDWLQVLDESMSI
jgi:hypothetical protein